MPVCVCLSSHSVFVWTYILPLLSLFLFLNARSQNTYSQISYYNSVVAHYPHCTNEAKLSVPLWGKSVGTSRDYYYSYKTVRFHVLSGKQEVHDQGM